MLFNCQGNIEVDHREHGAVAEYFSKNEAGIYIVKKLLCLSLVVLG